MKLFDSELKVMEVLWENGELSAKEISDILNKEVGWNINTTYTIIKKCINKGAIKRREPKFMCKALVQKEEIQNEHTEELIDKLFDGSAEMLFASLISSKKLTPEKIDELKKLAENK